MRQPVCFGYEVRSKLPFAYLRSGGATDRLEVVESARVDRGEAGQPLREWLPRPDRPFHARLFREDGLWRMWVADLGSFHVDPEEARIEVPPTARALEREERLWGIPAVLCFVRRGDHSLHAASVQIGGGAIAVGAPGRFGKTTLAAAFLGAGRRLLSEDSTCIRAASEGPSVVPGPAMLRVRRDRDASVEVPGTVMLAQDADRVHLAVEEHSRGDGRAVPLRAIVLLRPSEGDETRLERISPVDAIADLWALSFQVPTDEDRARCFDAVVRLAGALPIFNLYRPLRHDKLPETMRVLEGVAG